ncbi:unnamed protein product [Effrenium voratum]|nr:unnamed protein product [Effrenium voratum]CAJ1462343.1 unnamed protein product [Effrenium voratum]
MASTLTMEQAEALIKQLREDHEALRAEVASLRSEVVTQHRAPSKTTSKTTSGTGRLALGLPPGSRLCGKAEASLYQLAQAALRPGADERQKKLRAVEDKLRGGASPDSWEGPGTPLLAAVQARSADLASLLLKARADPELADAKGPPLRAAVQTRSADLVSLLLKARADPEQADDKGVRLLHLAVYNGQDEVCRQLLAAKANHNATDCHGQTPIFFAPTRTICEALYRSHADMNVISLKGQSAVHLAAKAGLGDICVWMCGKVSRSLLLVRDAEGCLASDYARQAKVRQEHIDKLEAAATATTTATARGSLGGPNAQPRASPSIAADVARTDIGTLAAASEPPEKQTVLAPETVLGLQADVPSAEKASKGRSSTRTSALSRDVLPVIAADVARADNGEPTEKQDVAPEAVLGLQADAPLAEKTSKGRSSTRASALSRDVLPAMAANATTPDDKTLAATSHSPADQQEVLQTPPEEVSAPEALLHPPQQQEEEQPEGGLTDPLTAEDCVPLDLGDEEAF